MAEGEMSTIETLRVYIARIRQTPGCGREGGRRRRE